MPTIKTAYKIARDDVAKVTGSRLALKKLHNED
jgi:hypothetical protein